MVFHIKVPSAPRRIGDRVEALRRITGGRSRFSPGRIIAIHSRGAEFGIRWEDERSGIVRAADVRADPSAAPRDQQRYAVACPPGCVYPSSFIARIPEAMSPRAELRSPAPTTAPRGTSRFSRAPSLGRLVVGSDDGAHRLTGGASLFTAASSEFSTADSFAVHQQALQVIINNTIRPSGREHARLDALREYNQSGRRCLSHKSAIRGTWLEQAGLRNAFVAEGRRSFNVCTCKELCHLTLRREHLVEDTCLQLLYDNTSRSLHRQVIVKYEGEDGIDEGGLSKCN
eukprot:COSAG02_NODE_7710_length_2881_cov_3.761409_1_plen_286_part_00